MPTSAHQPVPPHPVPSTSSSSKITSFSAISSFTASTVHQPVRSAPPLRVPPRSVPSAPPQRVPPRPVPSAPPQRVPPRSVPPGPPHHRSVPPGPPQQIPPRSVPPGPPQQIPPRSVPLTPPQRVPPRSDPPGPPQQIPPRSVPLTPPQWVPPRSVPPGPPQKISPQSVPLRPVPQIPTPQRSPPSTALDPFNDDDDDNDVDFKENVPPRKKKASKADVFTCPNCEKTYKNYSSLYKHKKNVHESSSIKPGSIECLEKECHFSCTRIILLQQHLVDVHNMEFEREEKSFSTIKG